jgi:hypothetical protein
MGSRGQDQFSVKRFFRNPIIMGDFFELILGLILLWLIYKFVQRYLML